MADISTQTFAIGVGLTSPALEAAFAAITGHQWTRNDFAGTFQPGGDIDFDGFGGVVGLRHLNGMEVWAVNFGTGDDAAAIQAAVNFVQASSPGRGVVYVTPLAGARWDIDATIQLYSGISIIGRGYPVLNKAIGGAMFNVANCTEVEIRGLVVDGNNSSGPMVYGTDVTNLLVQDIVVGGGGGIAAPGDAVGSRLIDGPLVQVDSGAALSRNIRVVGNTGLEQNELAHIEDAVNVLVADNHMQATLIRTSDDIVRLSGVAGAVVRDNWFNARGTGAGGSSGPANGIRLDVGTISPSCQEILIQGNYQLGGAGHQCFVNDSLGVVIQENTFVHAGEDVAINNWDAIHVTAGIAGDTDGVLIQNNIASNFPANVFGHSGGCRYGIRIEANAHRVSIFNNLLETLGVSPGDPNTQYMCGTAGISVASTTGIVRRGNTLTLNGPVAMSSGTPANIGGTDHWNFPVPGTRRLSADTARHNQYLGVQVSIAYTGTLTAAAGYRHGVWIDRTALIPADGKFHTDDTVTVFVNAAFATPADWDIAYELIA